MHSPIGDQIRKELEEYFPSDQFTISCRGQYTFSGCFDISTSEDLFAEIAWCDNGRKGIRFQVVIEDLKYLRARRGFGTGTRAYRYAKTKLRDVDLRHDAYLVQKRRLFGSMRERRTEKVPNAR
jgi:hypothetical protein